MDTIEDIFPGKMGRVLLTRVAIRIKRPDILKMAPTKILEPQLAATLRDALGSIKKG